ncbi:hypothetical protein U3516DRAFT_809530 [Neocallimastix sp. 'constans']
MLYYILIIVCLIKILQAILVKNEKEFINNLSKNYDNIVINIDTEIDITANITINNSFNKLSIIGKSFSSSKLNFLNSINFEKNIIEIELRDIYIIGNINFFNNKRISLNSLILYGNINTIFNDDNNNEYIKLNNVSYSPYIQSNYNCLNLSGNVSIEYSELYGNSLCQNRLLHFEGLNKYALIIKYTNISGEYQCSCMSINGSPDVNIEYSIFEKGFSSKEVEGGSAIITTSSNIKISNCSFKNLLSYNNGGAFNLNNNINFKTYNLEFYNTTSLGLGSICHTSSDKLSLAYFYNTVQINTGNIKGMRNGGLIMNIENQSSVIIDLYYAENLINIYSSGSAFILSYRASLTIRNMMINNMIGKGEDGLFYYSHDSSYILFNAKNVTLNKFYQLNKRISSIISVENKNYVNLNELLYQENNSKVEINSFEVENFKSKVSVELINYTSAYLRDHVSLFINGLKLNNIISQGVIFKVQNAVFNLINSEIRNIHLCNKNQNCTNYKSNDELIHQAEVLLTQGTSTICFNDTIFENIYGDVGILLVHTKLDFNNSTIKNSHFKNGFFTLDEDNNSSGIYNINKSTFINNTSEYGTIINIKKLYENTGCKVNVLNSLFINNKASKFGGVIYSIGKYNNLHANIINCIFFDNNAELGDVIYGFSKKSLPIISNIKKLESMDGAVVTNPTKIRLNSNYINKISINSGDTIPKNISYKIFDDYDNEMIINSDISNIKFEEFIFAGIEINDTYHAILVGQTQTYCWGKNCVFPSVKVIGKPGTYTIKLKIKSFGPYIKFENDSVDIQIEILKCNNSYIYQNIESPIFKTCYIPKCEPSCNTGECINDNVCNCNKTHYTGNYWIFLGIWFIICKNFKNLSNISTSSKNEKLYYSTRNVSCYCDDSIIPLLYCIYLEYS